MKMAQASGLGLCAPRDVRYAPEERKRDAVTHCVLIRTPTRRANKRHILASLFTAS
jgi:hypothetical protein